MVVSIDSYQLLTSLSGRRGANEARIEVSQALRETVRRNAIAAHISNSQTMIKLKGGRGGQTLNIQPTEILEVEGGLNVDDVRKLAMPLPFNQPSGTLFQLLGFLVDAGKGVVRTTMESSAESDVNMPVGTKLANIEQGMVVYSAIHGRMHNAIERVLSVLHRLNGMYLDDKTEVQTTGSLVASRSDFNGPMDVVPVSDPNIFSETQRYAQLQAVLQLRTQFQPGSFKDPQLLEQAMRLLNYPNYEDVLNTPLEAEERTALDENVVAANPQSQLEVYELQDHLAHLQTHVRFMASPIFCANPLMAPIALPKLMEHCRKHLLAYYQENVEAATIALKKTMANGAAALFPEIGNTDALTAAASQVRMDHVALDRSGPDDRHLHDQIVEGAGFQARQHRHLRSRFDLEDVAAERLCRLPQDSRPSRISDAAGTAEENLTRRSRCTCR